MRIFGLNFNYGWIQQTAENTAHQHQKEKMFKSKVFTLSKRELKEVPFQLVYEDGPDGIDQRKAFAKYSTWALPQALAYLGKLTAIKNTDGMYDGVETVKLAISRCDLGSEWFKGLLFYLRSSPRGTIIPTGFKATSPEMLPFCALVPLFLAAFKKYQAIPYSKWVNCQSLIDKDLYSAMTCTCPSYTSEELLEIRTLGSTIKSGDKAGSVKNPLSTTTITSTGVEEFDNLPRLAKVMLTQVWLAHPTMRHEYMVLNPSNWDEMPKSLIETDVMRRDTSPRDEWDI